MATWATGCTVEVVSITLGFTSGAVNVATVVYQVLDPNGKGVVTKQLNVAATDISSTDMTSLLSLHGQGKSAAQTEQGIT
jgi:hypothetical protein